MTDDQQVRALLTRAAELPDDLQPPVARLIRAGRRARRRRAVGSVLTVVAVTGGLFALPPALRTLFPRHVMSVDGHGGHGPTAAQLARFRWSDRARSPLGERSGPLLAWTGHELIELGGTKHGVTQDDGAVFDPATGRWALIAHVKGNVGFANAVDVWTGHELFVTNGQTASCLGGAPVARCLPRAGLYDPAANRWTTTPLPKQLAGLTLTGAAWTGREVVLAAINPGHARLAVAAYNPLTHSWRVITPRLPADHPPLSLALVSTPRRVLLWSLWSKATKTSPGSYRVASGIDILALGKHGWSTVTGGWPQGQTVDSPGYGGGTIFMAPSQIWCGACSHPFVEFRSRLVDAATLAITQIPAGPLARHQLVQPDLWLWTGRAAIAMDLTGQSSRSEHISQVAAYDPATRHWHVLPLPFGDLVGPTPVWAGRQLLVLTSAGALWTLHR